MYLSWLPRYILGTTSVWLRSRATAAADVDPRSPVFLLGIFAAAYAAGLESGEGIDTTEETATPSIIIFWDKAPKDTKDFFTRFDIPLEWVHDFEGDDGRPTHTVYTADNTHAANRFLTAIIRILESEDDSYGEHWLGLWW
jgi:hypothetical protein